MGPHLSLYYYGLVLCFVLIYNNNARGGAVPNNSEGCKDRAKITFPGGAGILFHLVLDYFILIIILLIKMPAPLIPYNISRRAALEL